MTHKRILEIEDISGLYVGQMLNKFDVCVSTESIFCMVAEMAIEKLAVTQLVLHTLFRLTKH